jgi:hypothetical protein
LLYKTHGPIPPLLLRRVNLNCEQHNMSNATLAKRKTEKGQEVIRKLGLEEGNRVCMDCTLKVRDLKQIFNDPEIRVHPMLYWILEHMFAHIVLVSSMFIYQHFINHSIVVRTNSTPREFP